MTLPATARRPPSPAAFSVDTGSLAPPAGTVAGDPLWVDGFLTPFGSAPPDFNAVAVNDELTVQLAGSPVGGGGARRPREPRPAVIGSQIVPSGEPAGGMDSPPGTPPRSRFRPRHPVFRSISATRSCLGSHPDRSRKHRLDALPASPHGGSDHVDRDLDLLSSVYVRQSGHATPRRVPLHRLRPLSPSATFLPISRR